ncbi:hypothetical protein [Natronorubrum sp. FCH18a]|uniref:hypothetical protein n=1 Tax=Natronorubrum sp. FCH18a TaxID=3447018 RepID=UPI003F510138
MRVRSAVDRDTSPSQDRSPDATNTDSSRALRTLVLVALGAAGVAYVVSRVVGSSDDEGELSLEKIRERTVDAVPSAVSDRVPDAVPTEPQAIPIGDVGSDEDETDTTDETETEADTDASSDDSASGAGEPVDDAETNVDLADDPSSAKITSGSSDEIQEKPAEPGELSVEDDVEDMIDEDDVGSDIDADESSVDEDDGSTADEDDTNDSTADEE